MKIAVTAVIALVLIDAFIVISQRLELQGFQKVESAQNELIDKDIKNYEALEKIAIKEKISENLLEKLVLTQTEDTDKIVEKIDALSGEIAGHFDDLNKRTEDSDALKKFSNLQNSRSNYIPHKLKIVELSKLGQNEDAKTLFWGQYKKAKMDYYDDLTESSEFRAKAVEESGELAKKKLSKAVSTTNFLSWIGIILPILGIAGVVYAAASGKKKVDKSKENGSQKGIE